MLYNDTHTEINLNLWKHFNEEADKTKDRMWTMASWMFTLQGAVIAFIVKQLFTSKSNEDHLMIANDAVAMATSLIGAVLGGYTIFLICQYGYHINGMWNRANVIRRQINGLNEIWFTNNQEKIDKDKSSKDERALPSVAGWLVFLSSLFIIFFIVLFFIALV